MGISPRDVTTLEIPLLGLRFLAKAKAATESEKLVFSNNT